MATSTELVTQLSVFFIFLFLFIISAEANTPLITETCKKTPDYDLCVSVLSTRAAKATSVKSLALAMVHVVEAKAKATSLHIKELLKTASSLAKELKEPLQACDGNYGVILDYDVPGAVTEVTYGNPKFGVDSMVDSAGESEDCEGQFRGRNGSGKSPLTSRNEDVRRVSQVAAAIIRNIDVR